MLPAKKRFKILLLASFFLLFGIERHYCFAVPVQGMPTNNQDENLQAQEVGVRVFIGVYIMYEGFSNILYWLFDWYQKKPGLYWYKHYRSFGYRTRLLSNRFYFDFYMRTWINILFALSVWGCYSEMESVSRSPEYARDICKQKQYDQLSNIKKMFLCFMFVPAVDLNICFGDNFYLVIGFRDIILMYFFAKVGILGKQINYIKLSNLVAQQVNAIQ